MRAHGFPHAKNRLENDERKYLSMELKDRGVLVTGGASGLGAACVRLFAEGGAKVLIADLNSEGGEKLAAEVRASGGSAFFAETNVTSEESVQAAVRAAVEQCGGLHILVNCAGIGIAEKVVGKYGVHGLESFQKVISVNLVGTFNAIRLASAVMAENEPTAGGERGVIINTASVAAFDGQIGQAAYSASKGGIVGMTLPIARELARSGIRVMTIAPGIFDTPLLGALPEPARISLGQQVPFPPRLGKPSEYAALAKHIVENEMLNGETIRLDGAIRMAPR
jgi:NAD(P)-dependent dehydrogenase (short-subunit alcohol dehydrogenase family)